MSTTIVADTGLVIDRRQRHTSLRTSNGLIAYAVPPGDEDNVWTVTVLPSTITPGAVDDMAMDWESFDVRNRAQAESLLTVIATLYARAVTA